MPSLMESKLALVTLFLTQPTRSRQTPRRTVARARMRTTGYPLEAMTGRPMVARNARLDESVYRVRWGSTREGHRSGRPCTDGRTKRRRGQRPKVEQAADGAPAPRLPASFEKD